MVHSSLITFRIRSSLVDSRLLPPSDAPSDPQRFISTSKQPVLGLGIASNPWLWNASG